MTSDVCYSDIDLDNPDFELPSEGSFQMRGPVCLGFRQLDNDRWPASPLYRLSIAAQQLALDDGTPVPLHHLKLKLNTLSDSTHYWIDSGSVFSQ